MFFLKKLVSRFFFPVPLVIELCLLGMLLRLFPKYRRVGNGFIAIGLLLSLAFGYQWLPEQLLLPLEQKYPAAQVDATTPGTNVCICVLGEGIYFDKSLPSNSRLSLMFLPRVMEGLRLHEQMPGSRLIVSMAGPNLSDAEKRSLLDNLIKSFNLKSDNIEIMTTARDTSDEVKSFKKMAANQKVYLVSSASHLPRAMVLARKNQLDAIPAPGGYLVDKDENNEWEPSQLFPSSFNYMKAERAIYEYLGLAMEYVR